MNFTVRRMRHYFVVCLDGRALNRAPFRTLEEALQWIDEREKSA